MLQVRAEIVCFHICDGKFEERSFYFCDIIDNLRGVVHYIYNVIYKIRVIILDQTGVLAGYDDFITGLFFYLVHDPVSKIIRYNAPGNNLSLMDAQ